MAKDPAQRMGGDEAMHQLAELAAGPRAARQREGSAVPAGETTPLQPEEPSASRPPLAVSPPGQGAPAAKTGPQPRQPWRSKILSARVLAVIAAVLVLIGGGIWAGATLLSGPDTRAPRASPALPYGDEVGLMRELRPGDCVHASWPAGRFKDLPTLKVVDCKTNPDGQVLDVNATTSLDDARTNGQGICRGLLRDTVRKMVDVQSFALVPSAAGWDNGARNTACLIFGKTVSFRGPVTDYRKIGDPISVETSSIGDCVDIKKRAEHDYAFTLVDCNKPHELQGLGYVRAPDSVKFDPGNAVYHDLCARRYGSYKSSTRDLFAWIDAEETWNQGFRFVMCLLAMPEEGQKLPPGSAVRTPGD
ncbi:septum formation family protein [Streptomyces sp. V1I1]|uniref:septum formation family protein n=1 Tax=Streptomyces sp. V1I1 TaxID=3042272 RepID=UPI00277F107A|nr:septum formation family protein [Streptomyces sp. V1I1]MDQ0945985.1 hypothetical protein [Streptomyces sp. V1I1]